MSRSFELSTIAKGSFPSLGMAVDATELVHFGADLRLDSPKNRVIASSASNQRTTRFAFFFGLFSAAH